MAKDMLDSLTKMADGDQQQLSVEHREILVQRQNTKVRTWVRELKCLVSAERALRWGPDAL